MIKLTDLQDVPPGLREEHRNYMRIAKQAKEIELQTNTTTVENAHFGMTEIGILVVVSLLVLSVIATVSKYIIRKC
ncbi:hypothetical protein ECANGB1_761 [Enterospora canceri]|uniref:Uncharacterized protein n=1 Tax=Enterospora canceri TaxID=1081671 RepID=A0A1Y1S484_9MICR|nr:hypothetical protein ECANGB1_761 [Enterospora canceri]